MTQLGSMYPLPTVSAVAQSVSRAVPVGLLGGVGGADLAADVRALFSANGGDFTGTMLDFTKTSRLYSDFEGTEAAAESTLALVVDDQQNGALGNNLVLDASASKWGTGGSNTIEDDGDEVKFTHVDSSLGGVLPFAGAGVLSAPPSVGQWVFVSVDARVTGGSVGIFFDTDGGVVSRVGENVAPADGLVTVSGYIRWSGNADRIRVATFDVGDVAYLSNVVFKIAAGAHAYQDSSGSRPLSTTDAFGARVAQPDGTDDHMDLPDVLGDGTQAFSFSFEVAPNVADSDSSARFFECAGGSNPMIAFLDSGAITFRVQEQGNGSTRTVSYARTVTDNEPITVTFQWAPSTPHRILVNGVVVAEDSASLSALNDPGAVEVFGNGTASNLAATCHGVVALTGTALPTTTQRETVEAYLADLASDPLLTADADTVLSRVFRPATDLNVTGDFTVADEAAFLAQFSDAALTTSADATSVFSAANDRVECVPNSGAATFDVLFPTRPGYLYRLSWTVVKVDTGVLQIDSAGYVNSGADIIGLGVVSGSSSSQFVALSGKTYVRFRFTGGSGTNAVSAVAIEEIPATGDYWDMLDETSMYSDLAGTLVEAEDPVQLLLSKGREARFGGELNTNPGDPFVDTTDWVIGGGSGTFSVVDGWFRCTNGSFCNAQRSLTVQSGALYAVQFRARPGTAGNVGVRIGNAASVTAYFNETFTADSGTQTRYALTTDTTLRISIFAATSDAGDYIEFRLASFKEVTGFPLLQNTANSRPTWALSGSPGVLTFDGTDDFMQAVDPDGDLAITGDVTVVSAVTATNTAAIKTVVASGDSTIATDTPYQASIDASELLSWEQADATNSETQTSANGPVAGTSTVVSWRRDGAVVSYGDAIQSVDSDTFTTVTSPTAGTSPATNVGIHVDGSSEPFAGSIDELVIVDRALSTGLLIHLERAATEKIA